MQEQINNLEKEFNILTKKLGIVTGEYQLLEENHTISQHEIEEYKKSIDLYKKCVELIQLVQVVTRNKVKEQFEDLVTSALKFVFGNGYEFKLEFDRRGSLSTMDFKIITPEHNEPSDPLKCESGGLIYLISLILRVVIMEVNKMPGFIICDETLKGLDPERIARANEFIHQLSEKTGRQILFISHEEEIKNNSKNVIEIK